MTKQNAILLWNIVSNCGTSAFMGAMLVAGASAVGLHDKPDGFESSSAQEDRLNHCRNAAEALRVWAKALAE